jgi:hypothetical protein
MKTFKPQSVNPFNLGVNCANARGSTVRAKQIISFHLIKNDMTFPAKHISVSIQRPIEAVCAFASHPVNLPKWAAGLSGSIKKKAPAG